METTQLQVSGMSCQACVGHVERALASVPHVQSVRVNLDAGRATVEHDGAEEEELVMAVSDAGYQAQRA